MAQFFYDGQIRRYIGQMIRMLSGFKYETSDGKQTVVPVLYGDMSRQVASILNDNSENKMPSAPRIAVYISNLQLDRSRLSDATHVSKVHIRERTKEYDNSVPPKFLGYSPTQGGGYTVERLMPTPYKLTIKADIWSTNTDQKLQIMEQLMMLFNPSLELQTTDNFVDWASLSVVELTDITFSSRTIPQGIDTEIDVGTLTFETPIWISPPSKVKRLGVIHDIIMNVHDDNYTFETKEYVTVSGFDIFVYANENSRVSKEYIAELLDPKAALVALADSTDVNTAKELWQKYGRDINWRILLDQYGDKLQPGVSQLFLTQPDGNEIVGTVAINDLDETKLIIDFDQDTYNTDTVIDGATGIHAIINPETWNPKNYVLGSDQNRFLLLNPIAEQSFAWDGFTASANDIIYWDDSTNTWKRIFKEWTTNTAYSTGDIVRYSGVAYTVLANILNSGDEENSPAQRSISNSELPKLYDAIVVYAKNRRTQIQYKFDNGEWTRAFEGEYPKGQWRLVI
jgi:hypothetical protein